MRRWTPAVLIGSCVAALGLMVTQAAQAGESAPTTVDAEGVVRNGEEAGCLLLPSQGSDEPYLLVGGDRTVVKEGARVRVTGILEPHLGGFCQQGIPLRVTSAERAPL